MMANQPEQGERERRSEQIVAAYYWEGVTFSNALVLMRHIYPHVEIERLARWLHDMANLRPDGHVQDRAPEADDGSWSLALLDTAGPAPEEA